MRERPFQKGGLRIPFSPQGRRFGQSSEILELPKGFTTDFEITEIAPFSVPAWDYHDLVAA